jgi:hypothetical protein
VKVWLGVENFAMAANRYSRHYGNNYRKRVILYYHCVAENVLQGTNQKPCEFRSKYRGRPPDCCRHRVIDNKPETAEQRTAEC